MSDVGVIQGRICPDHLDRLQVFPGREWKSEFKKAGEIGFDCIELLYDRGECEENPLLNLERFQEVLDLKVDTGVGMSSICADYFVKTNLIKDVNSEGWRRIDHLIDYAHRLDIKVIIIPFFGENQLKDDDELVCFLDKVKNQSNRAQECGIQICIETDLSAQVMMRAIQLVSSRVKVCYDLGNAMAFGFSPEKEISELKNLIGHVHIKDRKINGPNVMLGEGDVDFAACFNALREINYQGILVLETPYCNSPISEATKNKEFIDNLLLELRV